MVTLFITPVTKFHEPLSRLTYGQASRLYYHSSTLAVTHKGSRVPTLLISATKTLNPKKPKPCKGISGGFEGISPVWELRGGA